MGFTKEQRLKGLKKQAANMGYNLVASGKASVSEGNGDMAPDVAMRAAKKLQQFEKGGF